MSSEPEMIEQVRSLGAFKDRRASKLLGEKLVAKWNEKNAALNRDESHYDDDLDYDFKEKDQSQIDEEEDMDGCPLTYGRKPKYCLAVPTKLDLDDMTEVLFECINEESRLRESQTGSVQSTDPNSKTARRQSVKVIRPESSSVIEEARVMTDLINEIVNKNQAEIYDKQKKRKMRAQEVALAMAEFIPDNVASVLDLEEIIEEEEVDVDHAFDGIMDEKHSGKEIQPIVQGLDSFKEDPIPEEFLWEEKAPPKKETSKSKTPSPEELEEAKKPVSLRVCDAISELSLSLGGATNEFNKKVQEAVDIENLPKKFQEEVQNDIQEFLLKLTEKLAEKEDTPILTGPGAGELENLKDEMLKAEQEAMDEFHKHQEEKAAQAQKEQEEEAGFDFLDKLVESKFKSNLPPQDDEEESTQKPVEIMEPLAEEEEEPVEQENEEAPPLVESPTHSQRRPSVLPDVTLDDIEAHKAKTKKPKKQRTEEEKAAREAKKARKEERAAKRAEKEERRASKALEADVAAANKAKGDKLRALGVYFFFRHVCDKTKVWITSSTKDIQLAHYSNDSCLEK